MGSSLPGKTAIRNGACDGLGSVTSPRAIGSPPYMKMREAPWTAAARPRLCHRPRRYFKAASSRRHPRCLLHSHFHGGEEPGCYNRSQVLTRVEVVSE